MAGEVSFGILGPWEVRIGRELTTVPAGRQRTILASLLLSVGESVSTPMLAQRLWPDQGPDWPQGAVHTYVTRLRRVLGPELIQTCPDGYRLKVEADTVDLHRFRGLVRRAGLADAAEEELALLRESLKLWRGRPFGNSRDAWLEQEIVPLLMEEWFAATERRIDLELAGEPPGHLIAELSDLTNRYPTRESLWARLITALHRGGRRAEALSAYQRVRTVLSEELGLDPGERLVQLHQTVLMGDAADHPAIPPARREPPRPRQLPHDIVCFTGRSQELAALERLPYGAPAPGRNGRAPTVVAIDGAPGTGKTTLAVHWAHRVAHGYPDGQLYLNLRGYGPADPMTSAAAAESLLRRLGVASEAIPVDVDERCALLRTILADRHVLILLDNARDADQVRPLLPGTSGLVVVTSRNQLRSLSIRDGAYRVTLGAMPESQAIELLAATVGSARVAREPEAASRLVALCDHLPLALAVVAERAQRAATLGEVVEALEDEKARLDNLGTGENDPNTDLRAVLSWSYGALSPAAAATFHVLGLHPAGDIALEAAAALAGLSPAEVERSVDQLLAAHLLEQRHPRRYQLHDLIRLYAVDQARLHMSDDERRAAVRRLLDHYLFASVSADRQLLPGRRREFVEPMRPQRPASPFADAGEALAWLELEFDSLRAVTSWAATSSEWAGYAWRTTMAMTSFFDARIPWSDGLDFLMSAVSAARTANEPVGEAYTLNSVGCHYSDRGEVGLAEKYFGEALTLFQQAGHVHGEAMALGNLGMVQGEAGKYETARRHLTRALELHESCEYPRGVGLVLDNLGMAHIVAGDYGRAVRAFRRAHEILVRAGDEPSDAQCLRNMGRAYAMTGDVRNAVRAFRLAIDIFRRMGNQRWEAVTLADLGEVLHEHGHALLARGILRTAHGMMKDLADPRAKDLETILTTTG
ncbi:AfsR/SARP family transcriptional regulator [Nonomuraea jiangxiensis]|uniref:DNA-binding transcriptional activator of the SARP family n=1 Tax=Nonomuraea jiangxiensis TaxID=633440 RepID=A0A1G8I8T3_9ACTN|nr:BTAD domain-containing putative transcriptional regulator [Nonomuraea jiangxiensis]SDI15257.1 DNA-binding transcriptional activator of the SARP family [Nonomuraea jiangxiensis]